MTVTVIIAIVLVTYGCEQVIKKHGEVITPAALESMTYLGLVVKESIRISPTIQGVFRRASKTFPLGKYSIEKVIETCRFRLKGFSS